MREGSFEIMFRFFSNLLGLFAFSIYVIQQRSFKILRENCSCSFEIVREDRLNLLEIPMEDCLSLFEILRVDCLSSFKIPRETFEFVSDPKGGSFEFCLD